MGQKANFKLFIASILIAFSFSVTIGAKVLAENAAPGMEPKTKMQDKFEKRHIHVEGFTEEQIKSIQASMTETMKNVVNSLSANGTLTKEQADRILAHDREVLKSLTPEQKSALRAELTAGRKDAIDKLVKSGKITQEQADRLLKVKAPEKKADQQ